MNTTTSRSTTLMLLCALSTVGGIAHATQPPDVVQSDTYGNTAMGSGALYEQNSGYGWNSGAGYLALYLNQTGQYNTAFGAGALLENDASYNTAVGTFALELNGTGTSNTAVGYQALYNNTGGIFNVAVGQGALQANQTGSSNTAIGETALLGATGSGNIAIGGKAGVSLTTGNNNIYIGSSGANESGAIRIGGSAQTATHVAGIYGSQVTGSAVYVTSSGQLGVLASSERFKTAIAPMGDETSKLQRLRPVSFYLKADPSATQQYGLIAEEVAKVYPELVIRDDGGSIQGVRYEELAPMLLSEVQKQTRALQEQAQKLSAVDLLKQQLELQARELSDLKRENQDMQAAIASLLGKNRTVAMRESVRTTGALP
jgi:Chaperone of endosialidase